MILLAEEGCSPECGEHRRRWELFVGVCGGDSRLSRRKLTQIVGRQPMQNFRVK